MTEGPTLNYTFRRKENVTFAATATESSETTFFGGVRGAVISKNVTLAAEITITFQGRDGTGAWHTIQNSEGTAVSLTFAETGPVALVCPAEAWGFTSFEKIRLKANTAVHATETVYFTIKGLA